MAETMDTLRLNTDADASLGTARMVQSRPVVAGEFGTWQLVYTVGQAGLATGGAVRIVTDSDTDWGWPQVDDPSGPEYMTAACPPDAEVALVIPEHITVVAINTGRALTQGETVSITYGDRSGGGAGSRSQTFLESRRYFWFEVDASGSGSFVYLPDLPELSVVGGQAEKLIVVAPSMAVAGEEFRVGVKAEDRWGNPAVAYRGTVGLRAAGIRLGASEAQFGEDDGGVVWIDGCRITEPGEHRVTARDDDAGLAAESNPVVASEGDPQFRLYWGDPHGGQVVDPYKIGDFFAYARDVAGIHFAGFQRNDHVMTTGAYEVQQQEERSHYEPGRFVPLPGYEWSATSDMGGHHNIYFRRFDQALRRCGHRGEVDPSDVDTDLPHVTDMHAEFRHTDVVVTPHVGGTAADLRFHEPSIEPALEITSTHGQFEWFLRESLERKYRMGFVGGSDCYTGRPGDDHPGHQLRRYQKAGLTGLYATDLSLEAVLAAMKARRVYATSGVRIVAAVAADGNLMGAEYSTNRPPTITVKVIGTGPLERVELFRGLDLIHTEELASGLSADRVRVTWEGASRRTSYSGRCVGRFGEPRRRQNLGREEDTFRQPAVGGDRVRRSPRPLAFVDMRLSQRVSDGRRRRSGYGGHGGYVERSDIRRALRRPRRELAGANVVRPSRGSTHSYHPWRAGGRQAPDRPRRAGPQVHAGDGPRAGAGARGVRVHRRVAAAWYQPLLGAGNPVGHGDGLDEPGVRRLRGAVVVDAGAARTGAHSHPAICQWQMFQTYRQLTKRKVNWLEQMV